MAGRGAGDRQELVAGDHWQRGQRSPSASPSALSFLHMGASSSIEANGRPELFLLIGHG
jgi:hypothetical protein